MCRATDDFLFIRGKYNMIDIVNAHTLQFHASLNTKSCGVFSSITNHTLEQAYLGCYEGHFFAVDLKKMEIIESGYKKLK